MATELTIHIGMGKTGTTAIQNFFWDNRKPLKKHGILYPKVGTMSNAHHLLSPHIPKFLQGQWNFLEPDQWCERLSRSDESRILISSELMAWTQPEQVATFCRRVSKFFDLRIIIYLRRQDDIIMATYNQQIKAGVQKRDIHHILDGQIKRFNYVDKINPWAEAIGKDKILVRPYEKSQFHLGDIRPDLLHHAYGVLWSDQFQRSELDPNPRLSVSAMEFKRLINILDHNADQTNPFNDALAGCARPDKGSAKDILSPEDRIKILEHSTEINSTIAREYMGRESGTLFEAALPNPEDPWKETPLSDDDGQALCAHLHSRHPHLHKRLKKLITEGRNSIPPLRQQAANQLARYC